MSSADSPAVLWYVCQYIFRLFYLVSDILVDNYCLPKNGENRNPCKNGGKCEFINGEVKCVCPVQYEGPTCAGKLHVLSLRCINFINVTLDITRTISSLCCHLLVSLVLLSNGQLKYLNYLKLLLKMFF